MGRRAPVEASHFDLGEGGLNVALSHLQNAKGPASVGALPDRGSIQSPEMDMKMNKHRDSTLAADIPSLSRRGFLGAAAVASLPVAAAATPAPAEVSIDDFLARASASEKAWYHANALAEVMGEMHPDRAWRSHIDHGHGFCLVVGDERNPVRSVAQVREASR